MGHYGLLAGRRGCLQTVDGAAQPGCSAFAARGGGFWRPATAEKHLELVISHIFLLSCYWVPDCCHVFVKSRPWIKDGHSPFRREPPTGWLRVVFCNGIYKDTGQTMIEIDDMPFAIWLTGLSGAGKTTVAEVLRDRLQRSGIHPVMLDGDIVRHGLCKDLGFTSEDRDENVRRVVEVARLIMDSRVPVIVALVSPFRKEREKARKTLGRDSFLEVFVDTPLEVCEARDPKGLYAKARKGLIRDFTGIDSPYEPPVCPEVHLSGDSQDPAQMAADIIAALKRKVAGKKDDQADQIRDCISRKSPES